MRQIVGKAYTELGKELYEAQQELANHRNGVFEEWYTALGFKKQSVYNYINRYKFIVQQLDDKEDIESFEELPAPLQYAVANPNAESTPEKAQAKSEVLAGDIATLKEYRERIKELEKKAEAIPLHHRQLTSIIRLYQRQALHICARQYRVGIA